MSAWDACTMEPWWVLRWIECHPGFSGYVGAMGSVLAVVVAFRAPAIAANYLRREQTKAADEDSKILAASLKREATTVAARASTARGNLDTIHAHPPNDANWTSVLNDGLVIQPPPLLYSVLLNPGWSDDPRLRPFSELAQKIADYNNKRATICYQDRASTSAAWPSYWGAMDQLLEEVEAAANTG